MKFPFIQFYIKDHVADEALARCNHTTRSIWIEFIFAMHLDDRCGLISGTRPELALAGRCTLEELDHAIGQITTYKVADVTVRDGVVTLINRRMRREWKVRNQTRLRVEKARSNDSVTPLVTQLKPPRGRVASDCGCGSGSSVPEEGDGEKPKIPPLKTPLMLRLEKLFRRRESTPWGEKERVAFRRFQALNVPEEDIEIVERFYASDYGYLRHDLPALLNNFTGEIDKARDWFTKKAAPPVPSKPMSAFEAVKREQAIKAQMARIDSDFSAAVNNEPLRNALRSEKQMLKAELASLNGNGNGAHRNGH